jgi:hypothetical protein
MQVVFLPIWGALGRLGTTRESLGRIGRMGLITMSRASQLAPYDPQRTKKFVDLRGPYTGHSSLFYGLDSRKGFEDFKMHGT